MQIQKRPSRKKPLLVAASILTLLLAGTAAAWSAKIGPFARQAATTPGTSQQERDTGTAIKKKSLDNAANDGVTTGSDPSPKPVPPSANTVGKSTVGVQITSADENGDNLRVRTVIQTVTSGGTCTLSMRGPDGATYQTEVGLQALPSTSTCKGFSIPLDELVPGTWSMEVKFENDSVQGSATREVTIG